VRGSLGCAITGVAVLFILYFLFYLMMMMDPGIGILIAIIGMFVIVGTLVAFVVWVVEALRGRPLD
jgi:hypothetical protein